MNPYTTPLILPEERPPLEVLPVGKPPFWRVFWIGFIFGKILVRALVAKVLRKSADEEQAIYVRNFLEKLGGVWIKVGQVLALRRDLFSQVVCTQLSRLHDQAMSFSPELAREVIEKNLGCAIEDVFEDFQESPFAAASLSQVHKARLRENGEAVVVKVQRPFAKAYFKYDFKWLSLGCKLIIKMGLMKTFRLEEMMDQIGDMMEEELDYRKEASNVKRLGVTLKEHDISVPKIYVKYVTKQILVMEFLEGVFVSDYIRISQKDPERAVSWAKENGIDPEKVASQLLHSIFRQLYEDLLFHGDLHPGNIILLRDSRVAFIDFGNIGRIDPKFAKNYNRYFRAMATGALDQAADSLLISMGRLPAMDILAFKKRLMRVMEKQMDRSYIDNLPYHERSIANNSAEISEVMMEFEIEVNWNLLKMGRAFETIDQNIGALNPDFNFVDEIIAYHTVAAKRKSCKRLELLPSKMEEVTDFFSMIKSIVTEKAFQFSGQMSRVDQILAMVTKWLIVGFWLILILGLWIYIYQYHNEMVAQYHDLTTENWFSDIIEEYPKTGRFLWIGKLMIVIFILFKLKQTVKNLMKPRVREA